MMNKLKKNQGWLLLVFVAVLSGWGFARLWFIYGSNSVAQNDGRKPLYWVAPMDATYKRDQPGKSPIGMDLIPVYEEDLQVDADDPGTVRISPWVTHNLGVRTERVLQLPLSLEINTVGYITFDEKQLVHFHSRVEGWIERLAVTAVGDAVQKGQKLFELYSPQLVATAEEYLAALSSGNALLIAGAVRKLESLGVGKQQIEVLRQSRKVEQRLAFYAHRDGYIAALHVREGMFIQPAMQVLSVGDLETVWVIAEVFERQAAWLKAGQKVEMVVSSYPGKRWQGRVDYIYPVVHAQTRTVRARIVFDNPERYLKPDMYVQLRITVDQRDQVLSVPRAAVIRDGRMNRVVKALGDGRYRSVRIETGMEVDERVEVLAGLQADDEVVVSAQFLLDSESSIAADLSRIEGESSTHNTLLPQQVWTEGVIKEWMPAHHRATIAHGAVAEWSWLPMTMNFRLSEDINPGGLAAGQHVQFCVERRPDNQYLVTSIGTEIDKSVCGKVLQEHNRTPDIHRHHHD